MYRMVEKSRMRKKEDQNQAVRQMRRGMMSRRRWIHCLYMYCSFCAPKLLIQEEEEGEGEEGEDLEELTGPEEPFEDEVLYCVL